MPGRLGDDPLSRKKAPSTKEAPSTRSGPAAQQTSHNDVFFHRRTENPQPKPGSSPEKQLQSLGESTSVDERPEITEVTDLVRTAQDAEITREVEQLSGPVSMDEPARPPDEERVEETEHAPLTLSEPSATIDPPAPTLQEQAAPTSQPETQPQKSEGFFKRLFGRFGK